MRAYSVTLPAKNLLVSRIECSKQFLPGSSGKTVT